jgi:hypothetical protein
MRDPYNNWSGGLSNPATELYEITPNDAVDLATHTRALSVAVSGLIVVTSVGDTTAPIYVVAGAPFPVRAKRVWSTGTDATGIVGLV